MAVRPERGMVSISGSKYLSSGIGSLLMDTVTLPVVYSEIT
jgi:hypothetical protein